ncbi:SDR family NAD(P)-dependent oxidoreductase [bacterium]|nr:SDR family NAD(P)-dependent oxidoreductase [bacterium]
MTGHVVVTGAAGAIGGATAAEFRRLWPSARITLIDRDGEGLLRRKNEIGGDIRTEVWDLADLDALEGNWTTMVAEAGPATVLINCAGFMEVRTFAGMSWELGERLMNVDLLAPMRLMHLAVPAMIAAGGGCVVNVSSMAGRVPLRGCAYYGASKAGLAFASEIAALELAPKGVRVVTVYPGPVTSALEARAMAQAGDSLMKNLLPTGKPDALARKIVRACQGGGRRVVYPWSYRVADFFNGIAVAVTKAFSPMPLE